MSSTGKAVRRVVVAHDHSGRSVISSDELVVAEPVEGTGQMIRVWSADEPASYPDLGTDPAAPDLFPPLGGYRMILCDFPAGIAVGASSEGDQEIAWEENGIHRTKSTDLSLVLEGEMTLGTDGGVETILRAGDTVVMAGARHYWRNDGACPARMAFFITGAHSTLT